MHSNAEIKICSTGSVDNEVDKFIEEKRYNDFDEIYIVDLSVNEEIAKKIEGIDGLANKLFLFDHHKTAEWLNKYSWAYVINTNSLGVPECGTSILYKYMNAFVFANPTTETFVEAVRSYDTWDWKKNNNPYAKDLHDVLNIIGYNDFILEYVDTLKNGILNCPEGKNFDIKESHKFLLKYKRKEIDKFIESKLKQVMVKENYGVVLCDNYSCLSELGNAIVESFPDLDYVKLIYPGGVALRSKAIEKNTSRVKLSLQDGSVKLNISNKNRADFDVSVIAKQHGGGGHTNSAGYKDEKWYLHLDPNVL
jgi:oligoribonuclease NrnB/cAMP/cGMP phosphodiesterase (DHH superfamily)